jgi:TonB family protein
MSMSELDAIRSQISKCWSVPAGAKNAQDLQVTLRVQLDQTGMVVDVQIADESTARYSSGDTFFRAAADSAMRAVRQCSPLRNLPPEKYDTWRDIIMTFDPKEMLF